MPFKAIHRETWLQPFPHDSMRPLPRNTRSKAVVQKGTRDAKQRNELLPWPYRRTPADEPQSLDGCAKGEGIRGKAHFHKGAEVHCSKNTTSCLSVLEGTSTQLLLGQKENPFRGWQTDKKGKKKLFPGGKCSRGVGTEGNAVGRLISNSHLKEKVSGD